MTDRELDAIEKACAEATRGPWTANEWQLQDEKRTQMADLDGPHFTGYEQNLYPEDARFIAGARSWVPALLAEVRRLRAELAALCDAAVDADLHCWGPAYDPEKAKEAAHRLRVLAQPWDEHGQRSRAGWALLDRLRKLEGASAEAYEKAARVVEDAGRWTPGKTTTEHLAAAIRALAKG